MIKRLLKFLWVLFVYACLATVIAQVAIGGALWNKGGFDSERRVRLWSYLFEVDRQAIRQEVEQARATARSQANSTDRLGAVRRNAEAKGIDQLRILEAQLFEERTRYESMRSVFESRLTDLEDRQRIGSVGLVRETLEVLDPAQTKEILVRFLDEGALDDVVTMLVGMSPDRQRKIFAEFKSPEETLLMNDILLRIRSQSEANSEGAGS